MVFERKKFRESIQQTAFEDRRTWALTMGQKGQRQLVGVEEPGDLEWERKDKDSL